MGLKRFPGQGPQADGEVEREPPIYVYVYLKWKKIVRGNINKNV